MIIELHVLQNFVPANLNRDDTGSPKECLFGGYTRARISSQCFKRAMRTEFRQAKLMQPAQLAQRTVRAQHEIAGRLVQIGHDAEASQAAAAGALRAMGIKANAKAPDQTSYLLFLAPHELDALAQITHDQWDIFQAIAATEAMEETAPAGGRTRKRATAPQVPQGTINDLKRALDGTRAADLALFGRMIADVPERNVEAACQVAHALSTNRVDTEFDFFTAVDDLKQDDTSGAGMLGVVEFNSACFYRYANLDTEQLLANLGGDAELAQQTIAAFVQAMVNAVPTGKQNSMAAHNPPSFVLAVVRDRGQWNLANAFVKPVTTLATDLIVGSITNLDAFWGKLVAMYGTHGLRGQWVATMEGNALNSLRDAQVASLAALTHQIMAQVATGDSQR